MEFQERNTELRVKISGQHRQACLTAGAGTTSVTNRGSSSKTSHWSSTLATDRTRWSIPWGRSAGVWKGCWSPRPGGGPKPGVPWPRKSRTQGAQHGAPQRFCATSFPMRTSSNEGSAWGPQGWGNICSQNEKAAEATRPHAMRGCAGKQTRKNEIKHNGEIPVVEVMTRRGVPQRLLGWF